MPARFHYSNLILGMFLVINDECSNAFPRGESMKNQCGERKPVVIFECFDCRWEGGEVASVRKVGGW